MQTMSMNPAVLFPPESIGRFTRFKWLVTGVLAVALILRPRLTGVGKRADDQGAWPPLVAADASGGAGRLATGRAGVAGADPAAVAGARPTSSASTGASASVLLTPSLLIERAVDGRLTLTGNVPDEATRNQWVNQVRIGAQGNAVSEALRISPVTGTAPWAERLREATELLRERRLDAVAFDGDRVTLSGPRVASAFREETERLFRTALPSLASVATRG